MRLLIFPDKCCEDAEPPGGVPQRLTPAVRVSRRDPDQSWARALSRRGKRWKRSELSLAFAENSLEQGSRAVQSFIQCSIFSLMSCYPRLPKLPRPFFVSCSTVASVIVGPDVRGRTRGQGRLAVSLLWSGGGGGREASDGVTAAADVGPPTTASLAGRN